jgi:uncharacterized repeat protein (TIGR01451 family)
MVSNTGAGPTSGTVTVSDTLPTGLSPTAADNGTISGWSVSTSGQTITATRSDALAVGSSYPSLTLTVGVANNAPASVTNSASVSGGGSAGANASDPTTITPEPDLAIMKSHTGSFRQGDSSDTYTIKVSNVGSATSSGTVTVSDTLPAGLALTAADSGTINGWSYATSGQTLTATRSDALANGGSYPLLPVFVSVANNAPVSVTNSATVSGGAEVNTANDSASDPTTITQVADLTLSKSHTGNFKQGDSSDTYVLTVSNIGAGPTTGTVTVSDTLPTGLAPTAADNGTINGWSVNFSGQTITATRSDALAGGSNYPLLALTVSVAGSAPASVTNTASVSGGGELNTANDNASDPTTILSVTATQLVITTSATATAGTAFSLTVTAEDNGGNTAGTFSGTVTISSSAGADISPTSVTLSGGTATVPVTLTTAGTQTLTAAFSGLMSGTASVTVSPGALNKYLVSVPGGSSAQAGKGFLVAVQAADQFNNPITSYSGPGSVTASINPTSAASNFPTTVAINSSGLGLFLGTLQQVGSYTITAASGGFSGSAPPVMVTPGPAVKLGFATQPASTPTGVTLAPVAVQVLDAFGNLITGDNTDVVTIGIASGPGPGTPGFISGSTLSAAVHNGVATFSNLTLVRPGTYTLSEVVAGLYTGPNSTSFSVQPLQVVSGSFAGTPSGFSVQFNAPFLVNAMTPVLYGTGFGTTAPAPTVTLTQTKDGLGNPITPVVVEGSLMLNPATSSLTFLETDTASFVNNNTPLLPDGTYVARIRSGGATGLQASNSGGGFLDGLGSGTPGSGDFTATFTVNASHGDVLWVPATADGPGQPLEAPGNNQSGGGYPVYLDDTTGTATSILLTLNYNPALLTVSGATGANFTLLASSTPGHALLQYSGPALPIGNQTPIGFVTASVPAGTSATPTPYKAKDLLHLSAIQINGGAVTAVGGDALHLVGYVGDVDGNATYSSADAVLITRVGLQTDSGFVAYPLVDPVIVADTDGSGFVPADAGLQINEAGVGFTTSNLPNPPIPGGTTITSLATLDPTVSFVAVEDNTLYQVPTSDPTQQLSNGAGQHFYVGETSQGANNLRRGALRFDLTTIPAGSTITGATLTLSMSKTRAGAQDISLHQALKSWGEGNSNGALDGHGGEGAGVAAATGDATWFYNFFSSQTWSTPGGDFVGAASATTSVGNVGSYQWTGAGLLADVQQWVNNPTSNFGWILLGNETTLDTAKQFDTAANSTPSNRPVLTVDYLPPIPDLVVSKSHTGNFHQGDAADHYTIHVSNVGSGATSGMVKVMDTLPTGLNPTVADSGTINGWAVSVSGRLITATRTDALAGGGSYPDLTLTVSVASTAPASVVNTATVGGGGELNTANDSASDTTAITQAADLTIGKSHAGNFRQGDAADSYNLTVSNVGPGPTAGTVTVTDQLPAGLSATAADHGTINGWSVSVSGQTVTATRSDVLAGGASYPVLTLTVSVSTTAPASVTNSATVTGGGELNAANDSVSDLTTITPMPDLMITKTHAGIFRPGDSADAYSITVSNVGGAPTDGSTVTVTDTLPTGLTATTADNGVISGWSVSFSGQTVTATRSDVLNNGSSYPVLMLTVSVANTIAPVVTNTATVGGGGEINLANDTVTDPTATVPAADLTVHLSHTGNFRQGDRADAYQLTVNNIGQGTTNAAVMVTDTLPAGLTPTAANTGLINGWSVVVSGQNVTATRSDPLAAGSSYPTLPIVVAVADNAPASVTNTATVSGGGEVITTNNGASDPTTITQVADLTISISHTGNFHPGDSADTYTIVVSNIGPVATDGTMVGVFDTLPAGLAPTSADSGPQNGWSLTVTGQSIMAIRSDVLGMGSSYPALTLTVGVAGNATGSVINTVQVAGGGEVNPANDLAADIAAITQPPDLTIAVGHGGNFVAGSTGTYAITVSNLGGSATSAPVTIVDVLPAGLTYGGSAAVNGWSISVSGQTVTATRADVLAVGASYPTLTLTVSISGTAGSSVTDMATVSGGGESNLGNDVAFDVTTIFPGTQNPRRRGA